MVWFGQKKKKKKLLGKTVEGKPIDWKGLKRHVNQLQCIESWYKQIEKKNNKENRNFEHWLDIKYSIIPETFLKYDDITVPKEKKESLLSEMCTEILTMK